MKSAAGLGARVRAGIKRCEVVRVVRGTGWTHRDIRAGARRSWPIGSVVDDCVPPATPHNMVSKGHCWCTIRNDSRDTMIGAVRQVRVWPRRPASASSAHCRHGGDRSPSLACQAEHHGRSTTAAHAPGAGRVPQTDCIHTRVKQWPHVFSVICTRADGLPVPVPRVKRPPETAP